MGVDIDRKWALHENDLILVDGTDNLYQAVFNRLTCVFNDMGYFYDDYGSNLHEHLGSVLTDGLLRKIERDIYETVIKDARITDCEVSCIKLKVNLIVINILAISDSIELKYNFILNSVTNQIINTRTNNTYMFLNIGDWKCGVDQRRVVRVGDEFTLNCEVYNNHGEITPVGVVDFSVLNAVFGTVDVVKGKASVNYTFPENTPEGEYYITAHYRGVGDYQNSTERILVDVRKRLPTNTKYLMKTLYGVAGEKVQFPVSVTDVLDGKVNDGDVEYSLQLGNGFKLATFLDITNMWAKTESNITFERVTLYDALGDPVDCGLVNFYIGNGDGFLEATRVTLFDARTEQSRNDPVELRSMVETMYGDPVLYGDVNYYYRYMSDYLKTSTELVNEYTYGLHGLKNMFDTTVFDEDNLPVLEGDVDFYYRKLKCLDTMPTSIDTKDTRTTVDNPEVYTRSNVVDEDDYPVSEGCINYNINGLGVGFKIESCKNFPMDGKVRSAMILDKDGMIIDTGSVITQTDEDGNPVTSYVHGEIADDDEETISFELVKVNDDDKEEDRE